MGHDYGEKGYRDKEVLTELYIERDMTMPEIADMFGVSYPTPEYWARKHGIPVGHPDIETRFEQKYEVNDETGCWEWTASADNDGYGNFTEDGEMIRAHRYSHKTFNSEIPDGMMVLHKCHNPPCVNPDHLYVGDGSDNMQDAIEAGTFPDSEQQREKVRKLDKETVVEIRNRYHNEDVTYRGLADEYGVHFVTISDLINGTTWADVGGPIKD